MAAVALGLVFIFGNTHVPPSLRSANTPTAHACANRFIRSTVASLEQIEHLLLQFSLLPRRLVGVVGAPEFGDGARALGAFAGVGFGFDELQGRALAQREQGRGQPVAMQPFEPGQREHRGHFLPAA